MGRVPASLLLHLLSESPYAHVCTRARTHVGEVHARVRRNGVASSSAPTATISLYYARIHGGQDRKRQLMHGTQHLIRYAARGGSWRTARRGVELSPPDDTISRGSINLYHRYPNNLWSNGRKSGSLSHLQRDKTRDAYFSCVPLDRVRDSKFPANGTRRRGCARRTSGQICIWGGEGNDPTHKPRDARRLEVGRVAR